MPKPHTIETISERVQLFGRGTGVRKKRQPSFSILEPTIRRMTPSVQSAIAKARSEIAINKARREGHKVKTDANGRSFYQPQDENGRFGRRVYI